MQLSQIITQAKRIDKITRTDLVKVKSYDFKTKKAVMINEKGEKKEYTLDAPAEKQLLRLLGVKSPIYYLQTHFDANSKQRTLLEVPNKRNAVQIVRDLIALGIRHKQRQHKQIIFNKNTDSIMAVVGRSYKRLPNIDALESAFEVYGRDIDPRLSYIGKREMKVFFKSQTEAIAPISREKILYGYLVGNSELGYASLSISKGMIILRCTNGLVLARLLNKEAIRHTRETMIQDYKLALNYFQHDTTILQMIDRWYTRPAIMNRDELMSPIGLEMLHEKLSVYGITNVETRMEIIGLLKKNQTEENKINNYWVGNAVTDYASNQLNDPYEANNLIMKAYSLMSAV